MSRRAIIFWFTGLSGAGKTTLATALRNRLVSEGRQVLVLDGDDVRSRLHRHLGFTPEDIRLNNELIAGLCEEMRADADLILVPIISPYRDSRVEARRRLAPDFHEIHISAPLDVLHERDTKGLYGAALRGEIGNLIGVSPESPYEFPQAPELTIHTDKESKETSVAHLSEYANCRLAERGGDGRA